MTLDDRLSALPADLRQTVLRQLAGQAPDGEEDGGIPRVARTGPLPLSPAQQRLWFLHDFEPDSVEYNVVRVLRLAGELALEPLRQALDRLVARHEVLRTTFDSVEGEGVAVVHPAAGLPVPLTDFSGLPVQDREVAVDRLLLTEVTTPFSLRRGPLFRAGVVRLGAAEHLLVLSMHHIVSDGWSMGVLARELDALYSAALRGEPDGLPELPLQYVDFAAWQRDRDLAGQLAHWRDRLDGLGPLELPTDRPRPAVRGPAGALHVFEVPAALTGQLKDLAAARGATLYMALVAAAQLLFARWSGQTDVAVGTSSSGRNRPELEGLIGFFVNTLVIRCRIDEHRSFADLLALVRATVLDAFDHDEVPFQRLVEALRPERAAGRAPLVQAMVNLHNADEGVFRLPGLDVTDVRPPAVIAKLDVTLDFAEHDGGLTGYLEYSTELFDEPTARRLGRALLVLLESVVERPAEPLRALPLTTAAERAELLPPWAPPEPADDVLALFAAQVRRAPDAIAVGDELTYRELDARAGRLANFLAGRGVGPDVLVALRVERGADLVTGMLGVLKAGGAYLPLDPADPPDRLAVVLADAGAAVVLTQERLRGDLDEATAPPVVCLDTDWPAVAAHPAQAPEPAAGPGNLAYAIYTSGSTGRPKGVLVERGQLAEYLWSATRDYPGLAGTTLLHSSVSFDLAVTSLWGTLARGGRLVVGGLDGPGSGGPRPSFLKVTPTHLPILLDAPEDRSPTAELVVGGEALLAEGLDRWRARHPGVTVINEYGPTEVTVGCVARRVEPGERLAPGAVPIGRPLRGARAYVLDRFLRPVPAGVAGEIYLGGVQVARGYHRRPGLTAERFVADPFGGPGERAYRTGDLARWRADGALEYLGRTDDQVKIHGYRVEPGEIESVLAGCPGVRQVAVIAREDQPGDKRLVAYVVAPGVPPARLRDHAAERLPGYLVPAHFVALEALPLTAGGKLDRRKVPAPEEPARPAGRVAPATGLEATLVEIWADVLGIEAGEFGVDDNFFDRGGDSIQAILVVWRARQRGIELTSKQLFLHQTVAELAPELAAAPAPAAPPRPARRASTGDVPLTPIQRWFFAEAGGDPARFNQSVFLQLRADVDEAALRRALAAVLTHHDAFALRFEHREPGGWRQWPSGEAPGDVLERVTVPARPPAAREDAERAAIARVQSGFALATGPLVKALLSVPADGQAGRLFLTAHHLVVDGVSWRILLADLDAAYGQAVRGEPVTPVPPSTSFADWAHHLWEHVRAGDLDADLAHWRAVEAATTRVRGLPVDGTGENTAESVRTVTVRLAAAHTDALLRRVPELYRTQINDVLLGALGRVLAEWTGGDEVALELEGHGREELFGGVDLTRTVGWFTTHYPVVLAVPRAGWAEVLKSVKEQLRAIPSQGLGYGALRYRDGSALGAGRRPEVVFNYLGRFDTASAEPGGLYAGWCPNPGTDGRAGRRGPLLEISGYVQDTELELRWDYAPEVHHAETVTRLAERFRAALERIVEHCAEPGAGGCTPSDFPLAALDQSTVDRIAGDGRTVEDIYPPTPTQSGMLFHSLAEPGTYVSHAALDLDGVGDPETLARAWQLVVDRTPVLRTALVWEGLPEPLQVVHRDVRLPVVHHDLRSLPEPAQEAEVERLWAQCRGAGFDVARAPLLRLTLVRRTGSRVTVLLSSHHLVVDGWSFSDVLTEVFAQHAILCGDDTVTLPPRRPYRDYVRWLAGQDQAAADTHWRDVLAGFSAPTPLPRARGPVSPAGSRSSRSLDFGLSPGDSAELAAFARAARVTVNTVVQGVWAILLARHAGEDDVCFGATVSGRPGDLPGADAIAGLFINTLPVRVRVGETGPLAAWLGELQAAQASSRPYEYAAPAQVARCSDVPAGTSLFDSIVVFENYPYDRASAGRHGLRVLGFRGEEHTHYPLTLTAYTEGELHLSLGYDPDLFDADAIGDLAGQLETLLTAMPAAPETRLADLPLLAARERQRLLAGWQGEPVPQPRCGVHELVERQVDRLPSAIAIRAGGEPLSYAELDERANRLAHHLIARGAGPGTLVGICLDRGPGLVAGLLAILKTGATYLALDPEHPDGRLRELLRDAGDPLVLTAGSLRERLPDPVLCTDAEAAAIAARPATRPGVPVDPAQAALLIYTSGSTGRPKGALNTHAGIVNRLRWMQHECPLQPGDAMLHKASVGFDSAVVECFGPLIAGATLVPARPGGQRDPAYLARLIAEERVTMAEFVPSMLRVFLDEPAAATCRGLRHVVCGGEVLDPDLAARAAEVLGATLHNTYGPTEAAVDVTHWRCGPGSRPRLGRPVWNARIHVLDRFLRLAPVGAPGELYVAGVPLGRGYHGRTALTAERFVADPFGAPGTVMYRTGDLGRWAPDGTLEFLGRTDDQVKVRGVRIEPGEIETVLRTHPAVTQACVLVRDDAHGDRRLVAYLARSGELTAAQARRFLAERVPAHLVPSGFVVLDRLPHTASGKIDRQALPAPSEFAPPSSGTPQPPGTELEHRLVAIWADVLGVAADGLGVADDFFELGGDSILAIRVISRIRAALGYAPSPRQLFDTPTIAELARALHGRADAAIPRARREGPLPLSFAQQRLWFLTEFDPDSTEYTTVFGLRLRGPLDTAALETALRELAGRHESLRTKFGTVDGRGVQVVVPPSLTPAGVDVSGEPDPEAALREFVRAETARPFDLEAGPPVRPALVRLGAADHALVLVAHHIVTDGWSTGVLAGELAVCYGAAVRGEPPALPTLPLQYADFAVWQRETLSGSALDEHLGYWRRELAGLAPLPLPTDRPRPAVRRPAGDAVFFAVPPELVSRLQAVAAQRGATVFMLLVAAVQALLARYTGQRDIAVGTVTSGRGRVELEGLVGLFANTVVLRSTVDESLSFADFLTAVRATVLGAFEHDDVPFERVVEVVEADRDPSRNAVAEVMVALNTPAAEVSLPGLDTEELSFGSTDVGHDLAFDFGLRAGALTGAISYATALFERSTVERMAGHLRTLLAAVAADPAGPLSALPLLTEPERHRLLVEWNGPELPAGAPRCVPEVFAEQVRSTPDAVAVGCAGTEETFAGLDRRANQLAHRLAALGAGPGTLVGVCLDRGVDAVVGLLGVLKAGAAFVPLDPAYPPALLAELVADAAAPVLVTSAAQAARVPGHTGAVVLLDRERPELDALPPDPPGVRTGPAEPAYVVYTSGTTGRPKGVLITHANLAYITQAWDARYDLAALRPRCLSVSGFGVDLFFADFLMSTLFGGTMVICPQEVLTDVPALVDLARASGAQLMVTVPALAAAIGEELAWTGKRLEALRVLAVGSEGWPLGDCAELLDRLEPHTVVANAYGATETTVDASVFLARREPLGSSALAPIGRPLPGARCYVLDPAGRLVPAGVPGELYVGGPGVAAGYWRRPGLTADRFPADPFGGGRLYRTGDRARHRADGVLEFLGRVDDQVKVRGFRVEPAEVESALVRHPEVAAAAVVQWEDGRLTGYVEPAAGAAPEPAALRAFLAGRLPGYAVPPVLVPVPELPKTPAGTLDRRRLPRPAPEDRAAAGRVAPRTATETALAEVWARVLGLEVSRIGVRDDFFDLGGDSILSIQLVFQARRAGLGFSSRDLFLHPTIERLAEVTGRAETVVAEQGPVSGAVPLTPAQREFLDGAPVDPGWFTQSVLVDLDAGTDLAALETALGELVRHHDALRMRFRREDGGWRQHNAPREPARLLERHDLSGVADQDAELRQLAEAAGRGLDLARGPLLRALVFEFGAGRAPALFLAVHHLVVDGVSWRILLDDLDRAYRQVARGEPVDPGPKTSSFRQWAETLTRHAEAGSFDAELAHWTAVPVDAPLPVDGTGPRRLSATRTVSVSLSEPATTALVRGAPAVLRTRVNEVLLAALAWAVSRWTGRPDVVVELEGHGREQRFDELDVSRTVGWFATGYPVALRLPPGEPAWPDLVRAVRRQLRAVPGSGLGYGVLRFLSPPGSPGAVLAGRSRPPVLFNYLGQIDQVGGSGDGGLYRGFRDSAVRPQSPREPAPHLLVVTGAVRDARLRLDWDYLDTVHHKSTVDRVAGDFRAALEAIAEHVAAGGTTG
ncbi:amino acid adenylation domain-containing protein [Amycolatopsis sp. cmx-4-61]|uniref:amino acid adenylation domain-containing protein n=1 Tax=Amycolatopsis sp. cmx-4-61 TaxID=2790937 RepID=UPI00397DF23E